MDFPIDAKLFDEDGQLLDLELAGSYSNFLEARFLQSPECGALEGDSAILGFATSSLIFYAIQYTGVTLPDLSDTNLSEIVFSIFPRKLAVGPEHARELILELRAFWSFLGREFGIPQQPYQTVLGKGAVERLRKELRDPENFGMAKSFVTGSSPFDEGWDDEDWEEEDEADQSEKAEEGWEEWGEEGIRIRPLLTVRAPSRRSQAAKGKSPRKTPKASPKKRR